MKAQLIDPESPEKEATLWIQMTRIGWSHLDTFIPKVGKEVISGPRQVPRLPGSESIVR